MRVWLNHGDLGYSVSVLAEWRLEQALPSLRRINMIMPSTSSMTEPDREQAQEKVYKKGQDAVARL